jgi:hypothetical protein
MYNAYIDIISGRNVSAIQTSDFRRMEFGKADVPRLIAMYNSMWDQCGAATDLPRLSLSVSAAIRRGGPAVLGGERPPVEQTMGFPRLSGYTYIPAVRW